MTESTPGTGDADSLPDPPAPAGAWSRAGRHAPDADARDADAQDADAQDDDAQDADARDDDATPSGPDSAAPSDAEAAAQAPSSRRRIVLIAALVGGVVILGGVVAALAGAFNSPEPAAARSASAVTLPSPTPTIASVARQPISPFADALPGAVLDYALTGIAPYPPLVVVGALEAFKVDYSNGGTGTVTVYTGQWETAAEAATAYATLVPPSPPATTGAATPDPSATATPPTSGTVEVGGQPAGTWAITKAAGGTGRATWTNGTALFQAVGPAGVVAKFYSAFPL